MQYFVLMIYTHKCVMIYKAFALVICNFYEIDDIHAQMRDFS